MKSPITKPEFSQPVGDTAVYLFDDWFDPIEAQVRERVRGFIHATTCRSAQAVAELPHEFGLPADAFVNNNASAGNRAIRTRRRERRLRTSEHFGCENDAYRD
jgi:hypothetical protein